MNAFKCRQCGAIVEIGERFCGDCGAPISSQVAIPSVEAPAPHAARTVRSRTIIATVCGLVAAVVIIVGGYFLLSALPGISGANETSPGPTPQPLSESTEKKTPALAEPQLIPGWKLYESRTGHVSNTNDWYSFQSVKGNIRYSIQYPGNLKLLDEMIFDGEEKIAELLPGAIRLKPGQTCFDKRAPAADSEFASKLLEEQSIEMAGLQGVRRVEESHYEGGAARESGRLFITKYCLSQGDKAFVAAFYEAEGMKPENKEMFDKVMGTLRLDGNRN